MFGSRETLHVCTLQMCFIMSGTKQANLCLSAVSLSQLITCQEIPGFAEGRHRARLHIILLLKVSDGTEIITHEIDSGISLKDVGYVRRLCPEEIDFSRQKNKARTNG